MIEPEVAELLESPCSLIMASVAPDGLPEAARGWAAAVHGSDAVRVLLAASEARMLANLADRGRMALTTTHFLTNVSWQLKGRARAIDAATAGDRIRLDAFCAGCVEILHEHQGTPEAVIRRLIPAEIVAVEMVVEQVFDQTPGPQAGARVAPVEA